MFELFLKKGDSVFVYPKGTSPSFVIEPQPGDPSNIHAWGLHSFVCYKNDCLS